MIRATAALALWALSAAAQQAALSPSEGPKTTVRGRVVDARTGAAIRGARVTIEVDRRTPADSSFADHDGHFVLREAPIGVHAIVSIKSGHEDFSSGIRITQSGASDLVLRMDRYAAIAGQVMDDEGKPVVGAVVSVLQRLFQQGAARYVPAGRGRDGPGRGTTDDRGIYRVWGLPFGNYVVAVRPKPESGPEGVTRFARAGAFYPGVDSLADATRVSLDWGQNLEGLNLVLDDPPGTLVAGLVSAPGGMACENCWATVTSLEGGASDSIARVRPNDEGALVIEGMAPGRYGLKVREFDRKTSSTRNGTVVLDVVEGRTAEFVLDMHEEQPVLGRIVLENRPEPDKNQSSDMDGQRPAVLMVSAYGDPSDPQSSARSSGGQTRLAIDGPGPFEFELRVPPGRARIRVTPTGRDGYLREVRLEGRPLLDGRIDVPVRGLQDLECVLSYDVGTVTGRVVPENESDDHGPLLGQRQVVRLIPVGGWDAQQLGRAVESDGSFAVPGVPPGRYFAYALPGRPGYAPDDPQLQSRLEAFGKTVEVRVGQATEVTLTVAPRLDELR